MFSNRQPASTHEIAARARGGVARTIAGVGLYGLVLLGKLVLFAKDSPASPQWGWLLLVSLAELMGWAGWTMERHDRRFRAAVLLIPAINSMYSIASVGLLAIGIDLYPFSENAIHMGMFLQSIATTHFWLFTALFVSADTSRRYCAGVSDWLDDFRVSEIGLWSYLLLGWVLAGLFVWNFYTSGAAAMVQGPSVDRAAVLATLETGKSWLVTSAFTAWIMVGGAMYLSPQARRVVRRRHIACGLGATALFLSAYGRLGNRRELSTGLLFICILLIIRGKKRILGFVVAGAVALGTYVGIERSIDPELQTTVDNADLFFEIFSEAVFPNYPLLAEVQNRPELRMGTSYVRLPALAMPTFGLWKKPLSLSQKFAEDYADGKMGYGYTPVAEGYANFGIPGVIAAPLVWVLAEAALFAFALRTGASLSACIPALLFLSLALDINRGEFASLGIELAVFSALCWTITRLCGMGYRTRT